MAQIAALNRVSLQAKGQPDIHSRTCTFLFPGGNSSAFFISPSNNYCKIWPQKPLRYPDIPVLSYHMSETSKYR